MAQNRGKTTPDSTPGSFAGQGRLDPEPTLTIPMGDRTAQQLVDTMRAEVPAGATILFEETDQGGGWLNAIGLRLEDDTRLDSDEAADEGIGWEQVEWAASNVRGYQHDDFVETPRRSGYWELTPAATS